MLVGVFSAFAQSDLTAGLIFLDGHADFHYPSAILKCDPADIELAILTGRGPKKIVQLAGKSPLLNDEDIVVFGIRAWDQIAESNIQIYDKKRMVEIGIKSAVEEGLENYIRRNLPLWLHFDVDVLDPELMPVMFPEPGGMSFDEVQEFLSLVMASGRIMGMSIACYHPSLDIGGGAGKQLASLISTIL